MHGREFAEPGQLGESGAASLKFEERLRWYLNRLRCMTPAEVGHRLVRKLSMHAERDGLYVSGRVPPPDLRGVARSWVHTDARVDASSYLAAADRIAEGKLDVFALKHADVGSPPRWNRDPKLGIEAPLTFGKMLDYRNPRLVGDIKYLWEINRHSHLVRLAQAYVLSSNTRYFDVIRWHLENWFTSCPYRMGPNWASALEAAIRLINWAVTWQLLGGAQSPLFEDAEGARLRRNWLKSIYQHAEFVRGYFSFYSSANNHLIGEASGLFIAALTWPHWPRTRHWLRVSKEVLEKEARLQNAPDGVNLEQAVSYQHFVLDLLLLSLLAGRANRQWFSVAYESRIEAMLEYLASIMDTGGNVPMFGDSDDAFVVNFAQSNGFSPYRALLAMGAILFQRDDFRAKAGMLDDKARWLLGARADALFARQTEPRTRLLPTRQAFCKGGYYILGCDFETESEIRLVVDAGPLGYRSIAAHGHADALAFTLSVGGMEFLIDPGTYAYHTQRLWRAYFRGTGAHNTVAVDGRDQSEPGGSFMWLRKARAGCSAWSTTAQADLFEGWHDGYMRLASPVMHRRRVELDKMTRRVLIDDMLHMTGEHDIALFFHCSERCEVDPVANGYMIKQGSKALILKLPQTRSAASQVYVGSSSPICGWISRRFDYKQPAPTIAWKARLSGEVVLRTEIAC